MNFFKSIILDDPEPPKPEISHESGSNPPVKPRHEDRGPNDVSVDGNADRWSFGVLIKTLATRSESVIETYSRDLKEFSSGLKKETDIIREAASRAVKDLPASLEAGTSAAHDVLDGVLKSTAEIISKESAAFAWDGEAETPETNRSLNSGRYSRFDAQLSAIQSDLNTFCEEPEDVEEYKKWKLTFELDNKRDEINDLIGDNGTLEGVYRKVVSNVVDQETFWRRYFYRVDKLKQQEIFRANLVKRAISVDEDDDDELSWDVDDEGEKDVTVSKLKSGEKVKERASNGSSIHVGIGGEGSDDDGSQHEKNDGNLNVDNGVENNQVKPSERTSERDVNLDEKETASDEIAGDEKMKSEGSIEATNNTNVGVNKVESGEKGDVSKVSSNHQAEEDLEWDEIEDIGSGDEKKISTTTTTTHTRGPNRDELRKQLSAAEDDDEDFSWDIEDNDEPVKS